MPKKKKLYKPKEKKEVKLNYASMGRRGLAVLIDAVFLSIATISLQSLLNLLGIDVMILTTQGGDLFLPLAVFYSLTVIYYIFIESYSGKSIGKAFLGLEVVGEGGKRITTKQAIIRNVLRLIDLLPAAYIVGLIFMIGSEEKQRLGDKVAHTFVIQKVEEGAEEEKAKKEEEEKVKKERKYKYEDEDVEWVKKGHSFFF
ncbi:MAG: RDD family protein [Candidatus Asgardarchaeia archaeon]